MNIDVVICLDKIVYLYEIKLKGWNNIIEFISREVKFLVHQMKNCVLMFLTHQLICLIQELLTKEIDFEDFIIIERKEHTDLSQKIDNLKIL